MQSDADNIPGQTAQGHMIAEHWARLAITYDGAVAELRSRGIEPDKAVPEDLHELDMIHMGGLAATDSLAQIAQIGRDHNVLDVGSGVGGPARRIASKYGALMWGVELSAPLYQTAVRLTELVDLQERVKFKLGSALALPFEGLEFDGVVMQHVAMQISEKSQLFGELSRVIRSGGYLAMHEIFGAKGEEPRYPLPWATEPAMSSLESLEDCLDRLTHLGFDVGDFLDLSEDGRQFHVRAIAAFNRVLNEEEGHQGIPMEATQVRLRASESMEENLRTGRIRVGMIVCYKNKG